MTFATYENIVKIIERLDEKPFVIEAHWDGDTDGWFIDMYLITKKGFWKWAKYSSYKLGFISKGSDLRVFNNKVPPWPEAVIAKEIGEEISKKYGLEFFFPSPDEPEDSCPRWLERDKAINCKDCNKLIIPTTSEYLPKEICYNCYLKIRDRSS